MLLLPIWKFGAKKYVGRSMREMEDYVPQMVAFNVDYFITLFVSVCMYSSGSMQASAVAILVDVVFTLMEFRDLRSDANHLYRVELLGIFYYLQNWKSAFMVLKVLNQRKIAFFPLFQLTYVLHRNPA
ncbi:hypothetical protein JG687_00005845 [Phytophthora cactorum]|uniref:Uncharacterized protein n=1 Tax=Phytophthora cactorum TaxID=29920 RepID=A0A329S438_9STRA|nr:hypothetical protein Pcac1_g24170 [Phytophthora cactorum]KAG2838221.1 hypothetical protein PC111_g4332 [Phytophthora cactorum]KAG2838603.1 hypothetical protein PC112_g4452 [Phytophthora cactorum]KAG2864703.1 hypothetical protein PC113_g4343 [Phytophthora cactorum]KAG2923378.1 hypothetical protein PC114_g4819 [Phytophthora cactorum]